MSASGTGIRLAGLSFGERAAMMVVSIFNSPAHGWGFVMMLYRLVRPLSLMALVAGLTASCAVEEAERTSLMELAGGRDGQIALLPSVEVDGLEELSARTGGTVFVEEVILHARRVALQDGRAQEHDITGTGRVLLRYSPAAPEAGLSRIWTEARPDYSQLTLDVSPLSASPQELREESRARGFDVSALAGNSVVVRGFIFVPSAQQQGLEGADPTTGCTAGSGRSCDGMVPDTAPAAVSLRSANPRAPARDHPGMVPDTAPAKGDDSTNKSLIPGAGATDSSHPDDDVRPFVLMARARFPLVGLLDPVVSQGGGLVSLHLNANDLFTDERLNALADDAAASDSESVVTSSLPLEDVSGCFQVQSGSPSVTIAGPRPR